MGGFCPAVVDDRSVDGGDSDVSDDKVPGNAKGPMLKPDGSVPAAGDEWTDGDGKKWRVCASGQACANKWGRIHVYDVTSGKGNKVCIHCQNKVKGVTHCGHGGMCRWPSGCSGRNLGHNMPGYRFCTEHRKLLQPKVNAVHGKGFVPPDDFDFAPFYPPPPTVAAV